MELYYESQASPNSCFIHATNMYFQRAYLGSDFLISFAQLVKKHSADIDKLKSDEARLSFYGEMPIPDDQEESSEPSRDEDLRGYYDIYLQSPSLSLLDDIKETELRELSPTHVLFLLEFQVDASGQTLTYVPHRFYHRYARKEDVKDQAESRDRFSRVASQQERIYLAHVQNSKSHAYTARRREENKSWVLLDSLRNSPVDIPDEKDLFEKEGYGGRASILVAQDPTRLPHVFK